MKDLVFKGESNQVLTNSLLVAEKFGKDHKRVLQDIRDLKCSNQFRQHNFVLSSYCNEQNRELPMYVMNKDGFTLLVMGYTGETAMKFKEDYIDAFNKMEEILAMVTPLPTGSCTICIEFSIEYIAGIKTSVCCTEDTCEKAAAAALRAAKKLKNELQKLGGR